MLYFRCSVRAPHFTGMKAARYASNPFAGGMAMHGNFDHEGLECPRCGKHVLVRRGSDYYQCLWCGFRRNLSEPEGLPVFLVIVLVFLYLLL